MDINKIDSYTNINQDVAGLENLDKFEGYFDNRYFDPFIGGYAFVFVTKPMLFIDPVNPNTVTDPSKLAYLNMTRDQFFVQFLRNEATNPNDKILPELLSYKDYKHSNFLKIFTNKCKSFDVPDTSVEQTEAFETKQGYKEILPTHKTVSEAGNSLSMQISESSNLDVTKLLGLWVNYINNIGDGVFDANPAMITDGILDYTSSIYYFVMEPDGRTLKYWAKFTGCWPTTIPYSRMQYSKNDHQNIDLDVQFVYNVKEDMDPNILKDFNRVSLKLNGYGSIKETDQDNMYYTPIKSNALLNIDKLKNIANSAGSATRDPLILYVPGSSDGINTDATKDRYVLSFGLDTNSNTFDREKFGDNYYYQIDNSDNDSFFNDKSSNDINTSEVFTREKIN